MTKEAEAIIASVTKLLADDKVRGYVMVGVINEDGKMDAAASVKDISPGDLAVSAAGIVSRVHESKNLPKKQ